MKTVLQITEASMVFALPFSAVATLTLLLPSDEYTWMTIYRVNLKMNHNLWGWVGITAALKHIHGGHLKWKCFSVSGKNIAFFNLCEHGFFHQPLVPNGTRAMVNASIQIYHRCFVFSTALWCDGYNSALSKMAPLTQAVISTAG